MSEPSDVSIALVDTLGRQVLAVPAQAYGPGEHHAAVSLPLARGAYVLRLTIGSSRATRQFHRTVTVGP